MEKELTDERKKLLTSVEDLLEGNGFPRLLSV